MKSANNIKPRNGVPYCEKHGVIYKKKITINGQPVIGYAVDCKCEEWKNNKEEK